MSLSNENAFGFYSLKLSISLFRPDSISSKKDFGNYCLRILYCQEDFLLEKWNFYRNYHRSLLE